LRAGPENRRGPIAQGKVGKQLTLADCVASRGWTWRLSNVGAAVTLRFRRVRTQLLPRGGSCPKRCELCLPRGPIWTRFAVAGRVSHSICAAAVRLHFA
jgi:hypothetical protein